MTTMTMTAPPPTAPADAPSIATIGDFHDKEVFHDTPRYRYRFSSRVAVETRLSRYDGMEVLATAYEVQVERNRPVSSDYDPYLSGQVVLRIAYLDPNDRKVTTDLIVLGSMTTNGYPTLDDEPKIRAVVTSWLAADNTAVVSWWKSLAAKMKVASSAVFEQARTDLILSIVEMTRQSLYQEMTSRLGIDKNMNVKVVRGRKVPIGTLGKVFWVGTNQFGRRVGLKDSNGTVYWTSAGNIEIIDRPDESKVLQEAKATYTAQYASLFGNPR